MKTIRKLFASVKYGKQTTIFFIAIACLSCISMKTHAQCTPSPGMYQYSRVITDNFTTGNWLQADFDVTNNDVYIPTTLTSGGINYVFWADVHANGDINSTGDYSITANGSEKTTAIKKAVNGDVIVAGNLVTTGGHTVLFIMRTGAINWCRYYDQSTTAITNHVVVTETKYGDVVAASSSLSGSDDVVIVRTDNIGNLKYYDDHPIKMGSNTSESYPTINGICATRDDGFVLVGSSGYNTSSPDFIAALVIKYDSSYYVLATHTLNWRYTYRSYRSSYSFSSVTNTYNSASYATAINEHVEAPYVFTIVGYTSNCDQNGANGTYKNGFVFDLDTTGHFFSPWTSPGTHKIPNYYSGDSIRFNGISNTGDLCDMVGSIYIGGSYKTLLVQVPTPGSTTDWAEEYGSGSIDEEFSIHLLNCSDFISVGVSNDYTATSSTQPRILATYGLATGQEGILPGCNTAYSLSEIQDSNDVVSYAEGSSSSATSTSVTPISQANCENTYDVCGGCVNLSSGTYYSRVFKNTFQSSGFLQADYDPTNNNVFIASTVIACDSDIFLSSVHEDGTTNFAKDFHFNGFDNAMAVKQAANGELIIAGRTVISGYHVLFLMRTDHNGNLIWYKHYDQTNADLIGYVVITETSGHDIVAVGSTNLGNGSDNIAILRTDSSGNQLYYDDHPIYSDGYSSNPNQFSYIRGILATPSDNGFLICGTTGHNGVTNDDFYGGLVMKYDQGFTCSSSCSSTITWYYVFRIPSTVLTCSGPWNLNTPSEAEYVYANGMAIDGNGNIIVAGRLITGDPSIEITSIPFIFKLTGSGVLLSNAFYSFYNNSSFNGIQISGSHYIVTGYLVVDSPGYCFDNGYINSPTTLTLIASVDTNWTSIGPGNGWSTFYGSGNLNYGCSVFISGNGYITAGYSNSSGSEQPNIISVNSSGEAGDCYMTLSYVTTDFACSNEPSLSTGTSTSATANGVTPTEWSICGAMTELCDGSISATCPPGSPRPQEPGNRTPIPGNIINIYPNPSTGSINVDLNAASASEGVISITDVQGREVATSTIGITQGANHFELDISNLQPGIYFVKVVDNNSTVYPVTKVQKM